MDFEATMRVPTTATKEEWANDVWDDENCCNYSADGKKLIEAYNFPERIKVRPGTEIICSEAFAFQDYMAEVKAGEEIPLEERVSYLEHIELPDSLLHIGAEAFCECGWMQRIKLPKNLETIGNLAFGGCWSLKQIAMPSKLVSIGEDAFSECLDLKKVRLNKGLKFLGSGAFFYCRSLEEINLPDGLEVIGQDIFDKCQKLKTIWVSAETKSRYSPLLPKSLRKKLRVI